MLEACFDNHKFCCIRIKYIWKVFPKLCNENQTKVKSLQEYRCYWTLWCYTWRDSSFKISSSGELKILKPIGNSIMAEIYQIVKTSFLNKCDTMCFNLWHNMFYPMSRKYINIYKQLSTFPISQVRLIQLIVRTLTYAWL